MADRQRRCARDAGQNGRRAADGFRPGQPGGDSRFAERSRVQRAAGHVEQRLQPFPRGVYRPFGARSQRGFHGLRRAVPRRRGRYFTDMP